MVHKPKHKVHSFRGLLGDGGQDEINLERQNLNLAYRIVKLELMGWKPGTVHNSSTVQVWREQQTSIPTATAIVDFSEPDLLAAGIFSNGTGLDTTLSYAVTFDNTLFSRNIYITHTEQDGTGKCNYYIELEEVPVGAATLMQLKLGVARKLSLSENPPDA